MGEGMIFLKVRWSLASENCKQTNKQTPRFDGQTTTVDQTDKQTWIGIEINVKAQICSFLKHKVDLYSLVV